MSYLPRTGTENKNVCCFNVVVNSTLAPLIIAPDVPLTGNRSTLRGCLSVVDKASTLNKYLAASKSILKGVVFELRVTVDNAAALVVILIPLKVLIVELYTSPTLPDVLYQRISLGTVV